VFNVFLINYFNICSPGNSNAWQIVKSVHLSFLRLLPAGFRVSGESKVLRFDNSLLFVWKAGA